MNYTHEIDEAKAIIGRHTINLLPPPPVNSELWQTMRTYLANRKLSSKVAEGNYWYPSSQATDTVGRIVMPAKSTYENHCYWQARAMVNGATKRYQSPHGTNRLDAVIVVYPIDTLSREAVVVEGPMCALAAAELGRVGIALMGNTPPDMVLNHVALLLDGYKTVFLADSDALTEAGVIVGKLAARGVQIKLRTLSEKDLADSPKLTRLRAVRWEG